MGERFKESGAKEEEMFRAKISISDKVTVGKLGKVVGPPTDAGYDENNNDDNRNNLLMNFGKDQVNMSRKDLMTQEEWRQHRFDTSVWGKELPPHPPLAHFGKEPKDCIGLKLRPLKKVNNKVTPTVWGEVLGPPTDDSDENNVLMKFPAGEVNMSFADLTPTDPTDPKDPTEQDEVEDDSDSSSEDDSDDE